jgi:hypothetical protein
MFAKIFITDNFVSSASKKRFPFSTLFSSGTARSQVETSQESIVFNTLTQNGSFTVALLGTNSNWMNTTDAGKPNQNCFDPGP